MGYTLRVSVLDNCQLRCRYCLPDGPRGVLQKSTWLTIDHYHQIARAMVPLSIERIRFTGGEPLLRDDLASIIGVFREHFPQSTLALTTNGLRFSAQRSALVSAGLDAVTFHIDTLQAHRYGELMGRGELSSVIEALNDAKQAGLFVKINMVVQKGVNDHELVDFLRFSKETSVEVRFIELMNTGSAQEYVAKTFMSGKEILDIIGAETPVKHLGRHDAAAPAESFFAEHFGVSFGLIASDTRPFCEHCNRLRLSADGRLRTCLYEPSGHALRDHASRLPNAEDLIERVKHVVAQKTSFHPARRIAREQFSMSQIGG